MTWHEVIEHIQTHAEYDQLVNEAFLSKDLEENFRRFEASAEFRATLQLFEKYGVGRKLLDVGAGNGIASAAFSQRGYEVTSLEPDESELAGSAAIDKLAKQLNDKGITISKEYFEDYTSGQNTFDVVYARQCMHHARDLQQFCASAFCVLKPGGLFITVRDHEIYNETDKGWFLNAHPLHKLYGGENAYKIDEYKAAIEDAGFAVKEILHHYDSVINYAPQTESEVNSIPNTLKSKLKEIIGPMSEMRLVKKFVRFIYDLRGIKLFDESKIPGRLVTIVAQKPMH